MYLYQHMLIHVDSRERKLIPILRSMCEDSDRIESMTLDLGDIVILNDENKEEFIIERKTVGDLAASIIDGRYKEQSHRLRGCGVEPHRVIYIIEGSIDNTPKNCPIKSKRAIQSAIFTLSLQKAFTVFQSRTIVETAELVLLLSQQALKANRGNNGVDDVHYSAVHKRVKKANLTPVTVTEILLGQIPGISQSVAQSIANICPSMEMVIQTVKENPEAISSLTLETKSGCKRKIPSRTATILRDFLMVSTESGAE